MKAAASKDKIITLVEQFTGFLPNLAFLLADNPTFALVPMACIQLSPLFAVLWMCSLAHLLLVHGSHSIASSKLWRTPRYMSNLCLIVFLSSEQPLLVNCMILWASVSSGLHSMKRAPCFRCALTFIWPNTYLNYILFSWRKYGISTSYSNSHSLLQTTMTFGLPPLMILGPHTPRAWCGTARFLQVWMVLMVFWREL